MFIPVSGGLTVKYLSAILGKKFLHLFIFCFLLIPSLLAEDFYFDSDGVQIHYTIEGKGEPVLLIHGFSANIQLNWGIPGVIKALSDNFQVIALDNRGHGQSDKPHDPQAYGMNMVEDPIRLLDHLDIEKAHIVGYSMGGFITLGILAHYPERVLSAVVGGAGWVPPGQDILGLDINTLAESLEQGKGIAPLMIALTPKGAPQPTPEEIEARNKMLLSTNDPLALAAASRNSYTSPPENRIRSINVPVLALIGEVDPLKMYVDQLDRLMRNLKISVIPNANHMTALEDPAFSNNIKAFLIKNSSSASGNVIKK